VGTFEEQYTEVGAIHPAIVDLHGYWSVAGSQYAWYEVKKFNGKTECGPPQIVTITNFTGT